MPSSASGCGAITISLPRRNSSWRDGAGRARLGGSDGVVSGSAFRWRDGAGRGRQSRASRHFTARTDSRRSCAARILVCLLPATPATAGILNRDLFRQLKRDGALGGAYLINAGRGALQVESDIVGALDDGTLAAATLDVFADEPLPEASPFVDPSRSNGHAAQCGLFRSAGVAANILRQIERLESGLAARTRDRSRDRLLRRCRACALRGKDRRPRRSGTAPRYRFKRDRHMQRVGVDQRRGVARNRDVALPEQEIAAPDVVWRGGSISEPARVPACRCRAGRRCRRRRAPPAPAPSNRCRARSCRPRDRARRGIAQQQQQNHFPSRRSARGAALGCSRRQP